MNLFDLIRGRDHYLDPTLVRIYLYQALTSVAYLHSKGIFHRDIKPENILIESSYDIWTGLKLADFGSCRGIYSKPPYTEYISTRWYRAPECLLTDGYYGSEMDVWGLGCVFYEISALVPLFPGENEKDQVRRIHNILGTPDDEVRCHCEDEEEEESCVCRPITTRDHLLLHRHSRSSSSMHHATLT